MATTFESMQTAGRVYAGALLQLAIERNLLDEVEGQMSELAGLWKSEPTFAQLMSSAAIDSDARRASLRKIFTNRVHPLVLNLLLVLNDKGRTMMFPAVADAFSEQLDTHRKRERVFVTVATPLSDDQRKKVQEVARQLSGLEPVLVELTDPSLLGGMVFRVGDRVIDRSLKRRLQKIRRELQGRFDRHLHQAGQKFVTEA